MKAKHVVLNVVMLTAAAGLAADGDWRPSLTKGTDGKEREWKLAFGNWSMGGRNNPGPQPMSVTAREENGKWIVGMAHTYNKCTQYVDLSGASVVDKAMKGKVVLHVAPDAWIPPDHKPFRVEIDVDAKAVGSDIIGTYKVAAVHSADPGVVQSFATRSGDLTGFATTAPAANIPEKATFEMRMHGALVGGAPTFAERCLVTQLAFEGDRVVAAIRGVLSKKDDTYNLAVCDPKRMALTRSPHGIKGRVEIETETLDMAPVVYSIEIDARTVGRDVVGIYKLTADVKGADKIEVEGNFDGNWSEGATVRTVDARPWYSAFPGFVPVKPTEHPRLLFRKGDIEGLMKKAETPEGKAILARLRKTLNGGDGETMPGHVSASGKAYDGKGGNLPLGSYTMSHVAGYGLLYRITGEKKYAELGKQCFELALKGQRDIDDRYSFRSPGGALRAGPSLGWYAVGYDLCYDGWDAETREKFGRAIAEYNEGMEEKDAKARLDLETVARGTMPPGSNHFGMQVGGTALALLAVTGEPFVDQKRIDALLRVSERNMVRNMTEGFGDGGFFAEGDGTGSMSSQIAFVTALQAWKNAMGHDYANVERPNARMMTLKWIYLTIVSGGKPQIWPERGEYRQNIWSRAGLSGGGYFGMGFGAVPDGQKAALKWYYDRFLLAKDTEQGVPYDTISPYPHHSVCAFVNWPVGMEGRNPAEVLPHCYRDTIHGFAAWRSRWQDTNDVVISVLLKPTQGYMGAKPDGALKIMASGRNFAWGRASGDVKSWWQDERGTASVLTTAGGSVAVDFTGLSGAEVMLVTTGEDSGFSFQAGEAGKEARGIPFAGSAPKLTVRFFTEGATPEGAVKDYVATFGKRTVGLRDGNIALGKAQ